MMPAGTVSIMAALTYIRQYSRSGQLDMTMLPFLAQMGVLTAFTLFIANVQILTRILSSCPLFFWTIETMSRGRYGMVVLWVCLVYFLLGPIVFSIGLNWT